MKGLKSELSASKEKTKMLTQVKTELESKMEELSAEVDSANMNLLSSTRTSDVFNEQVSF